MIVDGNNYAIRKGKKWNTCLVRVWDPVFKKQISQSFRIPPELKGNKEKAFCIEKVKEVQFRITYRSSVTSPKITFENFFFGEWWDEASKTNCPPTMQDYRSFFNRSLKDLLGNVQLDKITPNTLNSVYKSLKESGKSDSYIYRMHKLIAQVLGEAKRRKILTINVARECMRAPPAPKKTKLDEEMVMSDEQCRLFLESLNKESMYWRTLYCIVFFTAMRREEVAALTWESYFKNNRTLKVEHAVRRMVGGELLIKDPKSFESRRKFGNSKMLADMIDAWNAECGYPREGFIFFSANNPDNPVHPDSISTHTRRLSKTLGFHFTMHTLRHTFISKTLTIIKADPKTVQSIAGHTDCRVTMDIYGRSENGPKTMVQKAYEDYFKGIVYEPIKNLNDADENFSLVSYVKTNLVEQNQTSSSTKLVQKFSETSFGPKKLGVLYIDFVKNMEPPEEFESPTC